MSESARMAAAEIVALVNACPRTPRPEQIEAIVAKALTHRRSEARHRPYPLEAKWNALISCHSRLRTRIFETGVP
jgi:hypothetical protein